MACAYQLMIVRCLQVLLHTSYLVNDEDIKAMKSANNLINFQDILTQKNFNYEIAQGKHKVQTPTKHGLQFIKLIVKKLSRTEDSDDHCHVEKVSEVTEDVWLGFMEKMKHEIKTVRDHGGTVGYEKETVLLSFPEKFQAKYKDLFLNMISCLKAKEDRYEAFIEQKDINAATEWCQDIESKFKDTCLCTFHMESNPPKITMFCDSYEILAKVKKRLRWLQNDKPATKTRKPAHGMSESLTTDKVKKTIWQEPQRMPTFSWANDAKNVKIFKLRDNLQVYVYVAGICNLPVDCIVNAANDSLSHFGGVARAIAKAAGKKLEEEGAEILKVRQKIEVGQVCVTTAGELPYSCVIHAVGPRWSDYGGESRAKKCSADLYSAVLQSIIVAEDRGLGSVALPAISSGVVSFQCY